MLLCLVVSAVASDRVLTKATEKELKLLSQKCETAPTAEIAYALILTFEAERAIEGKILADFSTLKKGWKEKADSGLVRLGKKWVSKEVSDEASAEALELLKQGLSLFLVNDNAGAEELLEKASEADQNAFLADFCLGLHFALANDHSAATRAFRRVLDRSPKHVGAMNNLAVVLMKSGKLGSAVPLWAKAAAIDPQNKDLSHNLGRLIREAGVRRVSVTKAELAKIRKIYAEIAVKQNADGQNSSYWALSPASAPQSQRPDIPVPDDRKLVAFMGTGTGFVVAENTVITNRHVVLAESAGRADAVRVSSPGGVNSNGGVIATIHAVSDEHDLAILRCENLGLPPLSLREDVPKLAEPVLALGFPRIELLGKSLKATQGTISALPTPERNTILFDAILNPGNSGGPLFDGSGNVIGVNTFAVLIDQPISGGVPSNETLKFLREQLDTFKAKEELSSKLEWPAVADLGGKSTVFIECDFLDAAPILTSVHTSEKQQSSPWHDFSCLRCRGFGKVPCKNPNCQGGKITRRFTEQQVHGSGQMRRVFNIPKTQMVDCPHCSNNSIVCPDCRGAGKHR